jgi:hypothetical protein
MVFKTVILQVGKGGMRVLLWVKIKGGGMWIPPCNPTPSGVADSLP